MSKVQKMSGVGAMKRPPRAQRLKNWPRCRRVQSSRFHCISLMAASFPRIGKKEWQVQQSLAIRQGAVKLYPAGHAMNNVHLIEWGPPESQADPLCFRFSNLNFVHGCLGPRERSKLISRKFSRADLLPRVFPGRGIRPPAVSMALVEDLKNAGE